MINFKKGYGSDEVGTGVYLLPSVYCCIFLNEEIKEKVDEICKNNNIFIRDSKKLYSNQIKKIYNLLKDQVPHTIYVLKNDVYNFFDKKYKWNDNVKKTFGHFKVYTDLKKDIKTDEKWFVDKFCEMPLFKNYYFKIKEDYQKNNFGWTDFEMVNLISYGDQKNLAIALASVFARCVFENIKKALEKKYLLKFPAGSKTTEIIAFAKNFKNDYSFENFLSLAKKKYKTTLLIEDIFKDNKS